MGSRVPNGGYSTSRLWSDYYSVVIWPYPPVLLWPGYNLDPKFFKSSTTEVIT